MFNFFKCYLSGRHDYGVGCEPGSIFLRCVHCGRRSPGWNVDQKAPTVRVSAPAREAAPRLTRPVLAAVSSRAAARVLPFQRTATQ
jgi:hypothetical protein